MGSTLRQLTEIKQCLNAPLMINAKDIDDLNAKVMILITNYAEINEVQLTPNLLMNLAEDVIDLMKTDSLEDVALMFKFARQGKLKMDSFAKRKSFYLQVTTDFIPAYLSAKAKERERIHYEDKKKHEANLTDLVIEMDEKMKDPAFGSKKEFVENLRKLRLSLTAPERKNRENPVLSNKIDSTSPIMSAKAFRESLIKECSLWDTNHLKQKIDDWSLLRNEGRYVDILENELKSRENE